MKKLILFFLTSLIFTPALHAKIVTEAVTYTDADDEYTSYLSYDDSIKTKRPGILVVHEWWGLDDYVKRRAEMLAKLGYVTFTG